MITIQGLSEAQCAVLATVEVGDLIFVQKISEQPAYDVDNSNEATGNGTAGDASQATEAGAATGDDGEDASAQIDTPSDSDSDNVSEHENGDESTTENSDATEATEVNVPPKMFVVSAISYDSARTITDVQVSHLTYSSTISPDDTHTYQIYCTECVHSHPSTCGQAGTTCDAASSIKEVLEDETFIVILEPNGDIVKNADQDVRGITTHGRCISGCRDGYLDSHDMLRNMVKDYDPPTLSVDGQDLTRIMPSVCPVCFGIETLQEQQNLQGSLLLGVPPEIGEIVDFVGSLNNRRVQLGYRFRQMDEREWGMVFDDMISEEGDDGDGDDRRWEAWAEAMDPNAMIQTRPASETTIASLIRKAAKDVQLGEDPRCKICQEDIKEEQIIIELPCAHADQHEECIAQWLKYNNTCPTCRAVVPSTDEAPSMNEAVGEGGEQEHEHTTVMDGIDAVMSDI